MRRIDKIEFKLSILLSLIITFIMPANVIKSEGIIEYAFGFPYGYWSIYQRESGGRSLFSNLFNGNNGVNINILELFINIMVIYWILLIIKKIYNNIRVKHTKAN